MRYGHVFAIDRIACPARRRSGSKMRHDLMPMQVEVDPMVGTATFGAAKQPAVKASRSLKVVDWKGKVEG